MYILDSSFFIAIKEQAPLIMQKPIRMFFGQLTVFPLTSFQLKDPIHDLRIILQHLNDCVCR